MAFRDVYRQQVALLMRALPLVGEEKDLALKGGTAINLFVRDMPRLSVDIDLTYLPVAPRSESLASIDAALKRIAARAKDRIPDVRVTMSEHEGSVTKLVLQQGRTQTRIEVTPVLRGCVSSPQLRSVSETVEAEFGFA